MREWDLQKAFQKYITKYETIQTKCIFPNTGQTSVLYPYWLTFLYFLTNLGPISLTILFFYAPNVANLGFLGIVPAIAF